MINVKDVVYLFDLNEKPLRSIPIKFDLEIEHVFNDIATISFKVNHDINVIVEQQLIYRGNRYVITEIEEIKSEQMTFVLAESLFTEMNDENVATLDVTNEVAGAIAERVLSRSKWKLGWVDVDDKRHSMLEENKSVLYLLRQLARLADMYLDFDTVNRVVNIRKNVGKDLDFIFRYRKK